MYGETSLLVLAVYAGPHAMGSAHATGRIGLLLSAALLGDLFSESRGEKVECKPYFDVERKYPRRAIVVTALTDSPYSAYRSK